MTQKNTKQKGNRNMKETFLIKHKHSAFNYLFSFKYFKFKKAKRNRKYHEKKK